MKTITANSIHLELDFNIWKLEKKSKQIMSWSNGAGGLIGITIYDLEPDLPEDADIQALQKKYQDYASNAKGELIAVEKDEVFTLPAIKTILKIPQASSGSTYIATYLIPRKEFFFTIKLQFLEEGITGIQDSDLLLVRRTMKEIKENTMFPEVITSAEPFFTDF